MNIRRCNLSSRFVNTYNVIIGRTICHSTIADSNTCRLPNNSCVYLSIHMLYVKADFRFKASLGHCDIESLFAGNILTICP